MDTKKLVSASKPTKLGAYVSRLLAGSRNRHDHGHGGHAESIRETEHHGRKIVIRTTYEVFVDGKVVPVPLGVDDQGQLHCHALPNYQFTSALDAIKTLVDRFPDDFPMRAARKKIVKSPLKKKAKEKADGGSHAAGHKHARRAKKGGR